MAVEPVRAQCPIDHRPGHIGHGSYSPWKYWTPRVYPVVACCRGVNRFEQPPGAAYRVCLKKYHNPDFIGYDGAYSGYDRAPQVLPTPTASPPAPAGNSENAPAPRSY
ncbi:MAG: hypothetical protein FJ271_30200 [Planctomycetes bacterium]|nr:hypothetical protein [Planctomycetota bacterium]